jgi:hypothetical protein
MKAIDPSEIIVEEPNQPKKGPLLINPWIRFIARFFDYSLFFLLLLVTRKLFLGHLPFGKYERLIPFEFFVWIPIEALLLSTWGTTPGKFLLKIKLKIGKKGKLDFTTALRRSFSVWFRGLGMGIVGLNFICLLIAYNKLKLLGITTWDRDEHIQVTQDLVGRWKIYIAVFVALAGTLYYYQEKRTEINHATRIIRSIDEHPSQKIYTARCDLLPKNNCCHWGD